MGHFSCLGFSSLKIVLVKGDCLAASKEITTFCIFLGGEDQWWLGPGTVRLAWLKRGLATILYQNPLGPDVFQDSGFFRFESSRVVRLRSVM